MHARSQQFEAADGKESKSGGPSRRQFWKETAVNALERYFYLIAFNAYLKVSRPALCPVSLLPSLQH